MAGMCGGMLTGMGGGLRLLLVLFGLILLGLAAAIVLQPQVLSWSVAIVIGFVGLVVLLIALLLRRSRDGTSAQ